MSLFKFRIVTLLVATTAAGAVITLTRLEFPTSAIALVVLFLFVVFAEDIWKWLPR